VEYIQNPMDGEEHVCRTKSLWQERCVLFPQANRRAEEDVFDAFANIESLYFEGGAQDVYEAIRGVPPSRNSKQYHVQIYELNELQPETLLKRGIMTEPMLSIPSASTSHHVAAIVYSLFNYNEANDGTPAALASSHFIVHLRDLRKGVWTVFDKRGTYSRFEVLDPGAVARQFRYLDRYEFVDGLGANVVQYRVPRAVVWCRNDEVIRLVALRQAADKSVSQPQPPPPPPPLPKPQPQVGLDSNPQVQRLVSALFTGSGSSTSTQGLLPARRQLAEELGLTPTTTGWSMVDGVRDTVYVGHLQTPPTRLTAFSAAYAAAEEWLKVDGTPGAERDAAEEEIARQLMIAQFFDVGASTQGQWAAEMQELQLKYLPPPDDEDRQRLLNLFEAMRRMPKGEARDEEMQRTLMQIRNLAQIMGE